MIARVLLLLAATALLGCPKPLPNPVSPDAADAAPPVCTSTPAICAYCAHMRALGCDEGRPTPKGQSCEVVTENVQAAPYAAMDLACRTAKGSCAAANQCR